MNNNMSLKKKSILALACYVCFLITVIGSITYYVVEPPIRENLENNLNLRTQLLAREIEDPLNHSLSTLHALVGVAASGYSIDVLEDMTYSVFKESDDIIISGGIWPEPNTLEPSKQLASIFFILVMNEEKSPLLTITTFLAIHLINKSHGIHRFHMKTVAIIFHGLRFTLILLPSRK